MRQPQGGCVASFANWRSAGNSRDAASSVSAVNAFASSAVVVSSNNSVFVASSSNACVVSAAAKRAKANSLRISSTKLVYSKAFEFVDAFVVLYCV